MEISPDYEELFKTLNAYRVKYLLVGAYAVMYYVEPRFTKDIDIWIIPQLNNPVTIYEALQSFGTPLKDISPEDFFDKRLIFQIGVAPVRVDILMNIPGVSYQRAWKNRKRAKYGSTSVCVLGIQELIDAKRKAGRLQDQVDLERLQEKRRLRRGR